MSGEVATLFFVAVLGGSSLSYAQATWTETLPDWIDCHVQALAAFTVATALLAHTHFADMQQKTQFLKNLAIAGGFLGFAVLGGGTYSVDGQMSRRGNGRVMARRGEVTAFD